MIDRFVVRNILLPTLAIAATVFPSALHAASTEPPVKIRVGHFPNITHAQPLIAQTNGWFSKALQPDAVVEWKIFNAGPAVIQALFANELDLAYIGPGPATNGYVKSKGKLPIVIAGAADGGAALVVRPDAGIRSPADFRGRRIATPQIGSTQDIALRGWLKQHGLAPKEKGGEVTVVPFANPDQLTLFRQGQIDGAWAPEPWAARLIHEGGGTIFLDERELWKDLTGGKFSTTVLVAHSKFLQTHPELVRRWVAAHVELTTWINDHSDEAKSLVNEELKRITGKPLPPAVLDAAWARVRFTSDPIKASIAQSARWAFEQGHLGRKEPDLSGLVDTRWLPAEAPASQPKK
ncbi:MAG: ABC transporter substrate-binding protein [Nitrospirota bacterium]